MALFNYECDEIKKKIDEVSPNYPQLTTYEKEWIFFYKYNYIPGIPVELECETVHVNPTGSVSNAIPFNYKSAILKGQTLVNTLLYEHTVLHAGAKRNGNTFTLDKYQEWSRIHFSPSNPLWEENETYTTILYDVVGDVSNLLMCQQSGKTVVKTPFTNNKAVFVMGTGGNSEKPSDNRRAYIESEVSKESGVISFKAVVLKGDYSNIDIPFFTGMISVQMPVLTTTGKNISPVNTYKLACKYGDLTNSIHGTVIVNNIKVKPNTKYIITYNKVEGVPDDKSIKIMTLRDKIIDPFAHVNVYTHPNRIKEYDAWYGAIITTESDAQYITITTGSFNTSSDKIIIDNIQLEEYDAPTPYEPYKSNILTVNDPVELRGIGDVKDELDLLTGELTQRIGEVVLDGSKDEKWSLNQISSYTTHTRFEFSLKGNKKPLGIINTELKCDRFTWIDGDVETEHIKIDGGDSRCIFVYIKNSKLTTQDVKGLKSWLQTNPLTIQYILETPTIKTVDLTPLNKPYEGVNHYHLTSNIPCESILEVPVVSTGEQTLQEINNY